jgi:hypothetical protein
MERHGFVIRDPPITGWSEQRTLTLRFEEMSITRLSPTGLFKSNGWRAEPPTLQCMGGLLLPSLACVP